MFYLVIILLGVGYMLFSILLSFNSNANKIVHKYSNHGTLIELIWTITPAVVLIAIAFPSFKLLYLMDEVIDPAMTIKTLGHQCHNVEEKVHIKQYFLEDSIRIVLYLSKDENLESPNAFLVAYCLRVVIYTPRGIHGQRLKH
ncbi:cytochrome C oxidase subunit II, transmembrane domain-containing protein [Endogone sp. FLAS-F59071]|nr:cytochrome C oxidase subunit II, transmembrane domain-containing protein [Endogone sp. FLAS-F59071]|eukprot:RUS23412.1 cytochrome C oxidase subunit II, transmembrane domain-containing protein [Endogone sp. FLAS-F59071]